MKGIGAGSRDDVDPGGRDRPGGEVEGKGANLELPNALGREVLRGAASDTVVDPRPVNWNHRNALGGAADRDLEEVIDVAGAGLAHPDAWLKQCDQEKTAPVQRQILD